MKNIWAFLGFLLLGIILVLMLKPSANAEMLHTKWPEFTQVSPKNWLKSQPLSTTEFKGRVVLMDIWTFACWNCYRSFPWLNEIEKKYHSQGLKVIGVHTPEFDYEKDSNAILEKMNEFQLNHPVMIDNDFKYWRSLNNRYWPTYYLIDKQGQIRYRFIGETHSNTQKSQKIENAIKQLLLE